MIDFLAFFTFFVQGVKKYTEWVESLVISYTQTKLVKTSQLYKFDLNKLWISIKSKVGEKDFLPSEVKEKNYPGEEKKFAL